MNFDGHISESAFLVNESRARNVELSRDRFAHLWVTDATRKLWEDFTSLVYPHDDIELPLRNRFFLDRLNAYRNSRHDAVFVNIGAGFTSYPFLTDAPCRCVEVDYPHVIGFKRSRIEEWKKGGLLPDREIDFWEGDVTVERDTKLLENYLASLLANKPSFVLMEGLTYYLDMSVLRRFFAVCSHVQEHGSALAFDYWTPDVLDHPVFKRFQMFFCDRLGHEQSNYNLFDLDYIRSIAGYDIGETNDIQKLEREFANTNRLVRYEDILPEHYAILFKRR
jgi:O-methyltransferase involved in polyketide biosynthesis